MKVTFKKLNDNAVMPKKAHPTDAGFDLVATSKRIDEMGNIVYGTGLAFEIPEGHVGLIFPRSSISKTNIVLTNSVGVCDCHFRGEVMAKFKPVNTAHEFITPPLGLVEPYIDMDGAPRDYEVGERIAQLIIIPIPEIEFEEVEELSETDRGTGGYGSTGK